MKKIYLLPVFLFCSCIPEDFRNDDNIYDSNLEKYEYFETRKTDAENLRACLSEENTDLDSVVSKLS